MTASLSLIQLAIIAGTCTLWGMVIGAALMFDVMRRRQPAEPIRVTPSWVMTGEPGPFPVDTAPLILMSDQMAALDAHERAVAGMISDAEALIPARWR